MYFTIYGNDTGPAAASFWKGSPFTEVLNWEEAKLGKAFLLLEVSLNHPTGKKRQEVTRPGRIALRKC